LENTENDLSCCREPIQPLPTAPSAERLKELRVLFEESGLFDARWYVLDNFDVRNSGMDPLSHFVEHGDAEGRSPGPDFNSRVYAATWPDAAASKMGPLEHFLRLGREAGRSAPSFTEEFYSLAFFEHLEPDESPLEHYLLKGRALGLKPPTGTKYEQWLELFDRIDAEDRDLIGQRVGEADFPTLTIIHVFDSAACRDAAHIIDALGEQISDRWTAVILFATEVTEAERAAVAARASGNARVRVAHDLPDNIEAGYVLLVHSPTRLLPHATFLFADLALSRRPEFAYGDHDQLTKEGRRHAPSFPQRRSARSADAGPPHAQRGIRGDRCSSQSDFVARRSVSSRGVAQLDDRFQEADRIGRHPRFFVRPRRTTGGPRSVICVRISMLGTGKRTLNHVVGRFHGSNLMPIKIGSPRWRCGTTACRRRS
jgi:hypothetical protein